MIINITEEQKKVIESQGYMVIQFKAWAKKFLEWFNKYSSVVIDTWNMIFTFLEQMVLRIAENLHEFGIQLKEAFGELLKQGETDFYIEPRPKYDFVRKIGRKYEVRYTQPIIYWRCRNNC